MGVGPDDPWHDDLFDGSDMAEQLVPDEIWAAIEPLLPAKRPHPKGGRPWIEDRAVLGGIIYVLRDGCPGGSSPPASWAVAAV
jgi:transposase